MPPETITNVCPKAKIAMTAIWVATLKRLANVKKNGDKKSHNNDEDYEPAERSAARQQLSRVLSSGLCYSTAASSPFVASSMTLSWVASSADSSPVIRPAAHHEDTVAHPEHFRKLAGDHQDAGPRFSVSSFMSS